MSTPQPQHPSLHEDTVDLLEWVHHATRGTVLDLEFNAALRIDEAERAGLIEPRATSGADHRLTPTGERMLREASRQRQAQADALPYGRVLVTAGPYAGQTGVYDDEDSVDLEAPLIDRWHSGSRAIVYLHDNEGELERRYALIRHRWLQPQ